MLRRVALTIQEGEFVTVMGPSGAGKSSLLNVLALLDDGWLGEYWFGETPAHKLNRKQRADLARQRIGMVFQSYHLLDDLTVAENIDLPLSYKNLPSKERAGMVADILDRFQIVAKKDLFPNQLSGGQQQLVGIARAVVHAPSLLLADEPTGNLHSTQAREIMELFRELNRQGTTIVQVTHSEENARYGSRILELRDGWLTRDEAAADLSGGRRTVNRPWGKFSMTASSFCARAQSVAAILLLQVNMALAVEPAQAQAQPADAQTAQPAPEAPAPASGSAALPYPGATMQQQQQQAVAPQQPFHVPLPHSHNPLAPYRPSTAPPLDLTNSPRLQNLIRDGKLYISLRDAIALAIENNLDLAYFRYNFPIAQTDIARTKAGGSAKASTPASCSPRRAASGPGLPAAGAVSSGAGAAGAGGIVHLDPGRRHIVSLRSLTQLQGLRRSHRHPGAEYGSRSACLFLRTTRLSYTTQFTEYFPTGTGVQWTFNGLRQTSTARSTLWTRKFSFSASCGYPASAGGFRFRHQRALHPHRQAEPADHRLAFKAQVIAP